MKLSRFIAVIIASSAVLFFQSTTFAQLVNPSGDLKLLWLRSHQESCSTGKPHGSYSISRDMKGLLYPTDCNSPSVGGDIGLYRFIDTNGAERCSGYMEIAFGVKKRASTTWRIINPASGYKCSTVGKTYKIQLRYIQ